MGYKVYKHLALINLKRNAFPVIHRKVKIAGNQILTCWANKK